MLIKEVNQILKAKCSKSFFSYIGYDSSWTFGNGSLNRDLFFLDNVHLVEKGNLKLAESIFSSTENWNGVTCNRHKQLLIFYKMAVSFKLNNFDFPPQSFSTVSKPVFSVLASLSFATAYSYSSDVSALSLINLSLILPNVCDGSFCSSNVYPSKHIRPSKPVWLNSVRPSKPIILQLLFFQVNLFAKLTSAQVNPSVQVMFIPVKLLVLVMIVKVNPLSCKCLSAESTVCYKNFDFQFVPRPSTFFNVF